MSTVLEKLGTWKDSKSVDWSKGAWKAKENPGFALVVLKDFQLESKWEFGILLESATMTDVS